MYIYRFLDNEGKILYIGSTKRCIYNRMARHFGNNGHLKAEQYNQVHSIDYIEVSTVDDINWLKFEVEDKGKEQAVRKVKKGYFRVRF